ncbi:MAG: cydA [Actinomycetia bacterium]|jgi:cytochrome d ubiquinol oxidase subunit I|nr:cydA [Actinomycetes bacterium]
MRALVLAAAVNPDVFYARQQMAMSLGFHIVIACLGMTFPFLVVFVEWRSHRTGDQVYATLARRWAKAMGVLFAVGAVSGTILSFEFGILWPRWMGQFGDVMGLPFALEGFAFFTEAIFVGIYLYGWDRLPPRVHLWSGIPIGIAGVASAFFVVAANGFMNDPRGFKVVSGRITDIRPWSAMFNSALWPEATHMILAACVVAGFLVAMPYAWAMLRGRNDRYHRVGLLVPLTFALIAVPFQFVVGDWAARHVAHYQPTKLAAMEGLAKTERGAPLHLGGWFDPNGKIVGGIEVPKALSLLAFHNANAKVQGLDAVAPNDRPPVNVVRIAFQLMVGIGTAMLLLSAWLALSWWRRRAMPKRRLFLWAALLGAPGAVLALESGWVVTEVGRQPWIVYRVMRVNDAVTDAPGIRWGYFLLLAVYATLAVATVFVLRRLARVPLPMREAGEQV